MDTHDPFNVARDLIRQRGWSGALTAALDQIHNLAAIDDAQGVATWNQVLRAIEEAGWSTFGVGPHGGRSTTSSS